MLELNKVYHCDVCWLEREDSYIDIIHWRLSNNISKKWLFDI